MSDQTFEDRPPESSHLTSYDEQNLTTYIRLLDADDEGADWREAVQIIFGIDPNHEPDRAQIVHSSHLARARWMTTEGYRHLSRPAKNLSFSLQSRRATGQVRSPVPPAATPAAPLTSEDKLSRH